MSFFERFTVKQEPNFAAIEEPLPEDDDYNNVVVKEEHLYDDDDEQAEDDDKADAKRPRSSNPTSRTTVVNESSVQSVFLRPTERKVLTASSAKMMPQQERLLSLDEYDEPAQLSRVNNRRSASRTAAANDSAHSAANFANYITARHVSGGKPVEQNASAGERYFNIFVKRMFQVPPSRNMPCSQTRFADPRFASMPLSLDHIFELCATARPNEPKCSRDTNCKALEIENEYGLRINDAPFVAFWFKANSDETREFDAQWTSRMCVVCECEIALRTYVNSHCSNVGIDPSDKIKTTDGITERVKLSVSWHVLVNQTGQFCQTETIGPDALTFNGLSGPVPRLRLRGWKLRPTIETNSKKFIPPYTRYVPPEDIHTRDGHQGF